MDRRNNKTNSLIKWVIFLGDMLLLNALLMVLSWWHPTFSLWHDDDIFVLGVVCNLAMILAQYKYSTIIHLRLVSGGDILKRSTELTLAMIVITYLILKLEKLDLPVGWLLVHTGICLVLCLLVVRLIERNLIKKMRTLGMNTRTITFVGSDPELLNLSKRLSHNPTLGYTIRGVYADKLPTNMNEEHKNIELRQLGTIQELMEAIEKDSQLELGDEVYVCMPSAEKEKIRALSDFCDSHMVHFYYVPTSVERLDLNLKREFLDDMEVYTTYQIPYNNPANKLLKRCFDILVSTIILICLLPLLPIVSLIILVQSPGPIFFRQKRTGINGHDFMCYKFRSMHVNKDADKLQATADDPRKFPFGSIMRKYNIDELPQFWNVLIGNMSIVGPRPHMLKHTEQYSQLIKKYMVRHFVKPGITGWAQVTGFRGETKELWQMEERVKRDIWYMEHWSIWLDFRIIWMTVKNMFSHDKMAY